MKPSQSEGAGTLHFSGFATRLHGDQSQGELTVLELLMFHSKSLLRSLRTFQRASKALLHEASKPCTLHRSSYLTRVTIMTDTPFKM